MKKKIALLMAGILSSVALTIGSLNVSAEAFSDGIDEVEIMEVDVFTDEEVVDESTELPDNGLEMNIEELFTSEVKGLQTYALDDGEIFAKETYNIDLLGGEVCELWFTPEKSGDYEIIMNTDDAEYYFAIYDMEDLHDEYDLYGSKELVYTLQEGVTYYMDYELSDEGSTELTLMVNPLFQIVETKSKTVEAAYGEKVMLTMDVFSGTEDILYSEWYVRESDLDEWTLLEGINGLSHTITAQRSEVYLCKVYNDNGLLGEETISILLDTGVVIEPVQLYYKANAGDTVKFQVKATAYQGVELSYEWYKWDEDTYEFVLIPGETKPSYEVKADGTGIARYRLTIRDSAGWIYEAPFTVDSKGWYVDAKFNEIPEAYIIHCSAPAGEKLQALISLIGAENEELIYTDDYFITTNPVKGSVIKFEEESTGAYSVYTYVIQDQYENEAKVYVIANSIQVNQDKTNLYVTGKPGEKVTLTLYANAAEGWQYNVTWYENIADSRYLVHTELFEPENGWNQEISSNIQVEVGNDVKKYICEVEDGRDCQFYEFTVSPVTGYTVSYNANGGSGAPAVQTKPEASALTLSTAVPTRTGYHFLGWAENANATEAAYKAGSSFTKNADVTLYAVWKKKEEAPVLVSAETTNNGNKFTWKAVSGIEGYQILRKVDTGSWAVLDNVSANTTSYVDKNVEAGTKYTYTVKAYTTYNGEKLPGLCYSAGKSVVVREKAPALDSATAVNDGVKFTWKPVADADGYQILKKTGTGNWKVLGYASASATSYVDKTVEAGTKYTYTAKSYTNYNGKKLLGFCYTAGKGVVARETAPVLASAEAVNSGMKFSWKPVADADGYQILRKTGTENWKVLGYASAKATSYVDKTVEAGTKYTYTAKAYTNYNGKKLLGFCYTAGKSAVARETAPVLVSAAAVNNGIKFVWKPVADADGYQVLRKTGTGNWKVIGYTAAGVTSYLDKSVTAGTKYTYTVKSYTNYNGKKLLGFCYTAGKSATAK